MASILVLIGAVVGANALGMSPDIGVITFTLGAILILLDPESARAGAAKIDWSTTLLVGGIVTYVGVLQHVGTIDMLAEHAAGMGVPLLAALLICVVAGLVSAFASTLGMLAVLVPLAVPLITSGEIPGWAMICAIGICASIVDVSPFSTSGATMIATDPTADERPRLTKMLVRWGLTLVVVGLIAMIGVSFFPRCCSDPGMGRSAAALTGTPTPGPRAIHVRVPPSRPVVVVESRRVHRRIHPGRNFPSFGWMNVGRVDQR